MAVTLIAKIKHKNGTSPLVDAVDVEMPDGRRLSEVVLGEGGSIDLEALAEVVKGAVLDENDKIQEKYLPEEKRPTKIDLSLYASQGKIVEEYADGSTVTHMVEFSNGKPVKVTTDDVTTTLEWGG